MTIKTVCITFQQDMPHARAVGLWLKLYGFKVDERSFEKIASQAPALIVAAGRKIAGLHDIQELMTAADFIVVLEQGKMHARRAADFTEVRPRMPAIAGGLCPCGSRAQDCMHPDCRIGERDGVPA